MLNQLSTLECLSETFRIQVREGSEIGESGETQAALSSSSDELPEGILDEPFFWLGLLLGELRLVLVLTGFVLTDKAYKLLLLRCSTRCSVDR